MRHLILFGLGLVAFGCGTSPTTPTQPATSSLVINSISPASGTTIVVPERYPYFTLGGVVIPPHSDLISVNVSVTSAHEVPWAQLSVYLLTGPDRMDYCGQNLPDAPTWSFLPAGWTTTYTVTGFQVFRLPCEVTGVRAMLHMRNNGLLIPPIPSETVAEATVSVSARLSR